jgi:CheY-like chemotaxis protein
MKVREHDDGCEQTLPGIFMPETSEKPARIERTTADDPLARLARVAARVTHSPLASIALTGEYRERCGPSTWIETAVYRRESSLAAWVLLGGTSLIVDDLAAHDKLKSHKDVLDLGVRAFAGVPIAGPAGVVIGCISVRDTRPRCFGKPEIETLAALAEIAARDLEFRGLESVAAPPPPPPWSALAGCSLLLVGPNDNRDLIQTLERHGARVRTTDDLAVAINLAVRGGCDAVIVCDLAANPELPTAIRGAGSRSPIVAIVDGDEPVEALRVGCDEVLLGPVDEASLVLSIVRATVRAAAN